MKCEKCGTDNYDVQRWKVSGPRLWVELCTGCCRAWDVFWHSSELGKEDNLGAAAYDAMARMFEKTSANFERLSTVGYRAEGLRRQAFEMLEEWLKEGASENVEPSKTDTGS